MTRKNNLTAKLAAVMMIVFMISSSMTTLAFAEPDGGGSQIAQLKQAMLDAEQAMNDAKTEMDQAEEALEPYKSEWENKKAEADDADAAVTAAETALSSTEQTVTDAIQQRMDSAQTAYDNAVAAYSEAEQAYNDAAQAAANKQSELNTAQAAKTALENEISTLTTEKMDAYALTQSLPSQIAFAEQNVTNANNQWEQEKQTAAAAVDEAQANYDETGYDFLNSKIDALGNEYYTFPEMIAICKGYTDKTLGRPCTFNGNSITTIADVANDELFLDIVKSNCTKENLLFAMDMVDESNVLRQAEGKSVMGVSYQLMGAAIMSNSYTLYSFSHDLYRTNGKDSYGYANTDSFWAIGPATWGNENLHANSAEIASAAAPFNGWYHNEKAALQAAVESGQWPGLSMDLSTREIWTNYPNLSNETNAAGFGQVGHYLTLKNEEYTTTGMAVTYNSGEVPTTWRGRATQSFNDDTDNSITTDKFRSDVNNAFADAEQALQDAQSAYQALESKPDYVTEAEGTYQDLQDQLTAAQTTVNEKTAAINEKQAELQNVESSITTLTQELETANDNKTAKEQAKSDALATKNAAEAAKTKADALDPDKPSTYDDDEELKSLVKDYNDADAALPPLRQDAVDKRAAAGTAEQTYNANKGDYDQKKEAYDNAVTAYNSVKAAYEDAADISKATITVADQTFSGKALTPAPKVDLNGSTLVKGSDYTVQYSNNTNAGTAKVTITGSGDYKGTVSRTFRIKAKAITPAVTLSKTAFTYNAKVQKPKVTVKTGSTTLAATNYTVTFPAGCKNVGVYKVTVKMKGNYSGTKTVSYKINPNGTNLKKPTAVSKGFTASWGKQAKKMSTATITGYQVQYSLNKNFKTGNKTVSVAGYAKTARKITRLNAKKVYYVRVRTYKKIGSTTLYSAWSKVLKVKTK